MSLTLILILILMLQLFVLPRIRSTGVSVFVLMIVILLTPMHLLFGQISVAAYGRCLPVVPVDASFLNFSIDRLNRIRIRRIRRLIRSRIIIFLIAVLLLLLLLRGHLLPHMSGSRSVGDRFVHDGAGAVDR